MRVPKFSAGFVASSYPHPDFQVLVANWPHSSSSTQRLGEARGRRRGRRCRRGLQIS